MVLVNVFTAVLESYSQGQKHVKIGSGDVERPPDLRQQESAARKYYHNHYKLKNLLIQDLFILEEK